jgi:hypothetical protein
MRPQIGDTVLILGNHPRGFARGQVGKVMGFTGDGRARVRIGKGYWARVRPENLVPLLDVYGKEAGGLENRGN